MMLIGNFYFIYKIGSCRCYQVRSGRAEGSDICSRNGGG